MFDYIFNWFNDEAPNLRNFIAGCAGEYNFLFLPEIGEIKTLNSSYFFDRLIELPGNHQIIWIRVKRKPGSYIRIKKINFKPRA